MYSFVLYFLTFSFLGWCLEVLYATLRQKRFVNRGFLYGPVCPIYGFGIAIVSVVAKALQGRIYLLIAVCCLLPTVLELITGFILEKIFATKWWDYSKCKFNLCGYICLEFSIIWAGFVNGIVFVLCPICDKIFAMLPYYTTLIVVTILCGVMIIDALFTTVTVYKLNINLSMLDFVKESLQKSSEFIGQNLHDGTTSFKEFQNKMFDSISHFQRRILKAFPHMKSKKYTSLDELRRALIARKKQKKEQAEKKKSD